MTEVMAGRTDHASFSEHRISAAAATGTWFFLVVLTLAAWLLARSSAVVEGRARCIELIAIVVLAAIKIYLVLDVFMGLRRAPVGWRIAIGSWLICTSGIILFFVLKS